MSPNTTADLLGPTPYDPGGRSKPRWPSGSIVRASFSECDLYRWELEEIWDDMPCPLVGWLLMNPSVAGIAHADPTLIRTGSFSRSWGYGGQVITNMHAARATDSKRLLGMADPVGSENDAAILAMARRCEIIVLAFGQPPRQLRPRAAKVITMLRTTGARLTFLRLSQDGTPQHPLYLPGSLTPQDFN